MLQFYFLSIVVNLLAGAALTADRLSERFEGFAPYAEILGRGNVKTSLGIVALVVGFLKLLIYATPNQVPVVGDLLPALAGLAMGAALVVGLIRERSGASGDKTSGFEKTVTTYRVPLGIAGLVIAVLHFLLPGALLL
ncbi:MAG: hypothetical protein JW820_06175 [Spirochaetales bacterium]|nr:hypothetical protein [Spirochaetales bacterium]